MPTISAAMIVKNEEHDLPECLRSLTDLVDEIVVVDTGSQDSSVEIARKYQAKTFELPWQDDFSAARNFAIDQCGSDWVLIIDADERIVPEDIELFRSAINSNEIDAYFLKVIDATGGNIHSSIRLFKRTTGIRYAGKIHEFPQLEGRIPAYSEIRIMHFGYRGSNRSEYNMHKHDRNIKMLMKSLLDEPQNASLLFHTGLEHEGAGNIEEAISYYEKAYKQAAESEIPGILRSLVIAKQSLELYSEALNLATEGTGRFPDYSDLFYLTGSVLQRMGKYDLAVRYFIKCIELGPPPPNYLSFGGVSDFLPLRGIGISLMNLGQRPQARKVLKDALAFSPEDKFTLDALKDLSRSNKL